jgi:DNA polymerase III alpha subunit
MRLDQFSNPIFSEQDIFEALYKGQTLSPEMFVELNDDIKKLEEVSELKFWSPLDNYNITLKEYDSTLQSNWYMPNEYKNMDIEEYVYSKCLTQIATVRVTQELAEYKSRNMLDLLRWLKYFVDTCEKEGVVWGIGRGSSVASYVLYIIGVHSVDSIKYNLDWQEFLR